jgi:nitrite reductase/ring-hydroxylating ferredoxin subunit
MKVELKAESEFDSNQWYEFSVSLNSGYKSIMVCKTDNGYIAFENFCPHQGRRLDYAQDQFLLDSQGSIICPAHGAEFDSETGLCTNGPCLGQSLVEVTISVQEQKVFAVIQD